MTVPADCTGLFVIEVLVPRYNGFDGIEGSNAYAVDSAASLSFARILADNADCPDIGGVRIVRDGVEYPLYEAPEPPAFPSDGIPF